MFFHTRVTRVRAKGSRRDSPMAKTTKTTKKTTTRKKATASARKNGTTKRAAKATATSTRKTTATRSRTKATTKKSAKPEVVITMSHDQIAERAYQIWVEKGRPVGTDSDNWAEAESQLRELA